MIFKEILPEILNIKTNQLFNPDMTLKVPEIIPEVNPLETEIQGLKDRGYGFEDVNLAIEQDTSIQDKPTARELVLKIYGGIKKFGSDIKQGFQDITSEETFDVSGKVDTKHFVYKLNEEAIPREARKMGLVVEGKGSVDSKGKIIAGSGLADKGDWWFIRIPKERAKFPIEAFGVLPFVPQFIKDKEE